MRHLTITAALLALAALTAPPARAEQSGQIKACPSRDKAEQIVQSRGSLTPDGCRVFTVTRVDSPAGAMCMLQFAQDQSGIVGQITSAFETTQWWAPCDELHAP